MPDKADFLNPRRLRALKRIVIAFFKHMGEPIADFIWPDEEIGGVASTGTPSLSDAGKQAPDTKQA